MKAVPFSGTPGLPQRHVATTLAALQDHRLPPEQTRAKRFHAFRAHRGTFRGDVPDTGLRDLGGQTAGFGRLISQTVPTNYVGNAAVIEGDAADGVAGFRPCLNRALRRLNRHGKFHVEGADNFD